jgi:hypothetical protein
MSSEITELLNALQDGRMTLDEVAQRFREHSWPRRRPAETSSYEEMVARELEDPDPFIPGSYDEVAAAYHQKRISKDQFQVLSEAVAAAQRAADATSQDH